MKALLKLIWFAVVIVLFQKVFSTFINATTLNVFASNLPFGLSKVVDVTKYITVDYINKYLFFIILFLGLDIISGDIKGLIKGPLKLILNLILYSIGFFIVFLIMKDFSLII
ncbi:MAG TPA: hypothetical protein VIK84_03745 [Haloplasmataceae bacterium]